jgi:short subunit dehydrogenase-like uncharacterized protein
MTIATNTRPWVLYGPTGVTGRLVLAEALARGHRPVLAGRDRARLEALAASYGLSVRAVDIGDASGLREICGAAGLILNAAGPFDVTGRPILDAAIAARCNYLDLNGELGFMLEALAMDAVVRSVGITAVVGVGFGIVAGDCIVAHVASRVAAPTSLRLSVAPASGFSSAAVAASTVAALRLGGRRVADGTMIARPLADRRWRERLPDGSELAFAAAPLAELAAALRTTQAADIMAGTPMQAPTAAIVRLVSPLLQQALRVGSIQRLAARSTGHAAGDVAPLPAACISRVWAHASNARGDAAGAVLETGEAYGFAARAAIAAVEAMAGAGLRPGVHTPSRAFGADFLAAVGGVTITDIDQSTDRGQRRP